MDEPHEPAEPDDDAPPDELREYLRGFLDRQTATGLAALSTLYWPVGRAWIRLKKTDKKEIKAAGGVKNYADKYFGKGYGNVNYCAASWKKYEARPDVHQKAMEWWEGLNEKPSLKQSFAPRVHLEVLELYINRNNPPPSKEDKEAEESGNDLGVSSTDLEAANHIIQLHETKIERLERENQALRRALIVNGIEVPMTEDLTDWMKSMEDSEFDTAAKSQVPAEAIGDQPAAPVAQRKRAPRKAAAKAPAKGLSNALFDEPKGDTNDET